MKLTLATLSFLAATVSSLPAPTEYETATSTTQEAYLPSPYPNQPNAYGQPYDNSASAAGSTPSSTITYGNGGTTPTCTKNKAEQTAIPGGKTYTVKVGGKDDQGMPILKYEPPVVYAEKGDTIVYDILFRNHTVTESTFDSPCSQKQGGSIASGFRPNLDNIPGTNTFKYTVVDTDTHWVYCGQSTHCQAGMVMAINPPKEGNTFEKFLQNAKAAPVSSDSTNTSNGSSKYPAPPGYGGNDDSSVTGYGSTTTSCTKDSDYPVPTGYAYSSDISDSSYLTESTSDYPATKSTECTSSGYSYPTGTGFSGPIYPYPTGSGYSSGYPIPSQSASSSVYSIQPVPLSSYTVPNYQAPTAYA